MAMEQTAVDLESGGPVFYNKNFEALVQLACNVMDAFTVAFFRSTPDGETLRLASYFSLGENVVPGVTIKSGQGMIGWVAKERRPLTVSEFSHDATTLKLYSVPEEIKSFMAVPVMDGERLVGVLVVDSKRQYVFTQKHQKLTTDFARVFALVANDQERVEELVHEASSIEGISAVVEELSSSERLSQMVRALHHNIGNLVENSAFVFALKSAKDGQFNIIPPPTGDEETRGIPLQLDQSLLGWVIKNKRFLNHQDVVTTAADFGGSAGEGHRSFLGVPMVVRQEVIGALGVLGKKEKAFNRADVRILSILGSVAASYVAGAYAYGAAVASRKTDPLTGLGNYIFIKEKADEIGGKSPAGMLVLDINDFSRITGDFSIDIADGALIEIAGFLKRVVAEKGHVGRYYGDVFLIYLPEHDAEETTASAKKLLDVLRAKNFYVESRQVSFDGKVGAAHAGAGGLDGGELIKRAFGALKSARMAGTSVAVYNV
ncbi:MAG: GAF domain-containing protein [Nitrospinae bacterium]|nr:GAF domain-containing protein [Nitrospinota bacterium]